MQHTETVAAALYEKGSNKIDCSLAKWHLWRTLLPGEEEDDNGAVYCRRNRNNNNKARAYRVQAHFDGVLRHWTCKLAIRVNIAIRNSNRRIIILNCTPPSPATESFLLNY